MKPEAPLRVDVTRTIPASHDGGFEWRLRQSGPIPNFGRKSKRKRRRGRRERRSSRCYEGGKSGDNSLHQWTEEDWGTRSGRKSTDTGERYLSKKAREALSDEEYTRTTTKKRRDIRKGKQFSSQPEDVQRKTARYRHGGGTGGNEPTKAELYDEARRRGLEGRSKMSKAALAKALGR